MKQLTFFFFLFFGAGPACASVAEFNLGVNAFQKKDYAQARVHWSASIGNGGPSEAFNNLGFLFYNGLGVPKDRERAVALWLKGAALAVSEAQFHLGQAYAKGHGGLRRSRVQAYAWYACARTTASRLSAADPTEKSIEQSVEEALATLAPTLSKADRVAAELLAKEYIAKYASPMPVSRIE